MRPLLACCLLLVAAPVARADGPAGLEVYLPRGVTAGQVQRALEDDLGSGLSGSVPLAVIDALVQLEPERMGSSLRESYARRGFLFPAGRDLPAGIVEVRRLGVRSHQFNCLACHAGRDPLYPNRLVLGATNAGIDFGGWYAEVFGGLGRQALAVRREGDGVPALTARLAARLTLAARRERRRRGEHLALSEVGLLGLMAKGYAERVVAGETRRRGPPSYGLGRTVVQAAYRSLRFGLDPGPWAPVKAPDLFGVRVRETLLWTANETFPAGMPAAERVARNGMLVPWIQLHPTSREPIPDLLTALRFPRYLRMGELLASCRPPPAPAPAEGEWAQVRRGQDVFRQTCASCHGDYELREATTPDGRPGVEAVVTEYPEEVLPAAEVGTDPTYTGISDEAFLAAFQASYLGRLGLFQGRVTHGYVARPLLGLRLRAPYLHNASVPNLRALLTEPASRPSKFLVGHGVPYDPQAVGLNYDEAEVQQATQSGPGPQQELRETQRPGDLNQGHPFGTDLSEEEKQALLKFLSLL